MSDTNPVSSTDTKSAFEALHNLASSHIRRLVELRADLSIHDRHKPKSGSEEWASWNSRLSGLRKDFSQETSELRKAIDGSGLSNLTRIRLSRHIDAEIIEESNRRTSSPVASEKAEHAVMTFYEISQQNERIAHEKKTRAEAAKNRLNNPRDPYSGIDLGI